MYGPGFILIGVIFVLCSLTDFLDGFLARRLCMESSFGALLDPFADKVLIISSSVGLMFFYFRNGIFDCGMIILTSLYVLVLRDLFVGFIRQYAEKNGLAIIPSFTAKIKTFYLFIVLSLEYFGVFRKIGYIKIFGFNVCFCKFFWVLGINLAIWSAVKYAAVLYRYIKLFKEKD